MTLETISIDYQDLNFDNPTVEDTEMHQRLAGQIELERAAQILCNERDAESLLNEAYAVGTHKQRICWLKKLGYECVHVKGQSRPVPLSEAPARNVSGMYKREIERLRKVIDRD